MTWLAVYEDGSYDIEESPSNFSKLHFDKIHHFTMWPKGNGNTAICIIKKPGYRLVWRKQRYVKITGEYLGSDYMLGLEPDDGSELAKEIESGKKDIYDSPMKKDPKGFRIWWMKEGYIRTAGALKRTDRIETYESDGITKKIKYITCEPI
jgi:hypothetical protein